MIKKSYLPLLFLFFFFLVTLSHAGSKRYTFVHPAPAGNYKDLDVKDTLTVTRLEVTDWTEIQGYFSLKPLSTFELPPCTVINQGTIAFSEGMLQVCRSTDGDTSAGWEPAGAFAQNSNTGNVHVPHGANLVIKGSTAPLPLSASGAGVRNVWAGNKKAFRAGEISGTHWDEANIGEHSVAFGFNNVAFGQFSSAFGSENQATGTYSSVAGGLQNQATDDGAFVGGGSANQAIALYSTVVSGYQNEASGQGSFIGGGGDNAASGIGSAVVAGYANSATGTYAAVVAGTQNGAFGQNAFVGGGDDNGASGLNSSVLGGKFNSVQGAFSTVLGGAMNEVTGDFSLAGGKNMRVSSSGTFAWGNSTTPVTINSPNSVIFYSDTTGTKVGIDTASPSRTLDINGTMHITPQSDPPADAEMGDMYVDSSGALCFFDGGDWFLAAGSGSCTVDFTPGPSSPPASPPESFPSSPPDTP